MSIIVQKFGGTSVASAANWKRIANLIENRTSQGLRVAVVHSALAVLGLDFVLTALMFGE